MIQVRLRNLVQPILRVCVNWLPPCLGGIVYSITLLLVGLLCVCMRAPVELFKFLTGQIPQSQLLYFKTGNPRSRFRPSESVANLPVGSALMIHCGCEVTNYLSN